MMNAMEDKVRRDAYSIVRQESSVTISPQLIIRDWIWTHLSR
jgi:hypothetical protein